MSCVRCHFVRFDINFLDAAKVILVSSAYILEAAFSRKFGRSLINYVYISEKVMVLRWNLEKFHR